MELFLKALKFAADKHKNQKRKNFAGTPYINHLIDVANLISEKGGVDDEIILTAAVLHDTIEDTDTTAEELTLLFGGKICHIVLEMSDDKTLDKKVRKQKQVEDSRHKSYEARVIKIADKISNVKDVLYNPPALWTTSRRRDYLFWAREVVNSIRGTNAGLEAEFDALFSKLDEIG